MLYKIVAAKALPNYQLWVRFEDGVEGDVDLSDLVGKGVFRQWEDPLEFARVYIDADSGTVTWPGGLDLAPDALYRDLAGISTK